MGLCSAKPVVTAEKNSKQIQSNIETTGLAKLDEIFDKTSSILKDAEKLRYGLEDTQELSISQTNVIFLQEPSFSEAVKVLFWSISANHRGQIKDSGLEIQQDEPYIKIQAHTSTYMTEDLNRHLTEYVNTILTGPKAIDRLISKLDNLIQDITTSLSTVKNEVEGGGLNAMRGSVTAGKNLNMIKLQVPKLKRLKGLIEDAVKDFPQFLEKLIESYKTADEIGAQAAEIHELYPRKIFDKYHTGLKKSQEEISKIEKQSVMTR